MNLTFIEEQNSEEPYWSSFFKFKPTNSAIELVLYNHKNGYEKGPLNWFYEIKNEYLLNEKQLFEFINQEIGQVRPLSKETYSRTNLTLNSIAILKEFKTKELWELDFCCNNDIEHLVIEMNKWNPYHLSTWA
ncbi:MAG: hypothetical protein ACI976_002356 [Aureispira sp.]|jgi:hypothetical protein